MIDTVDKASEPSTSQVDQPASSQQIGSLRRSRARWLRIPFLVVCCTIAGFFGAWLYGVSSGIVSLSGASHTTESRQRVIAEGEVVADIARQVSPSVVSIVTEAQSSSNFFNDSYQSGAGTGVILSKDGYVLTNKHVIPEGTQQVKIVTTDGTVYENVSVVGRDSVNDLAFLKISGVDSLVPATLGSSSDMKVGSKVVAIGNALGEFDTTVTSGIISGTNRSVTAGDGLSAGEDLSNLLQTDAAINPGNSGGPLVNSTGEVIGINTAISEGAEGIGFAIPIDDAKGLIKGVLANGKVERAYLGVRYIMITPEVAKQHNLTQKNGAFIIGEGNNTAIVSGSPADTAGLKDGDIITKVNDTELGSSAVLSSQLARFVPGDKVTLTILRDGKTRTLTVTLEKLS